MLTLKTIGFEVPLWLVLSPTIVHYKQGPQAFNLEVTSCLVDY